MKKNIVLILLLFASFFVFGIGWPVREGSLAANFGMSDGRIPLLGNFIESTGSVFPADVGDLIFVHDPENPAVHFSSPLGSWLAIDHGDNMVGIYSRFEPRRDVPVPAVVETESVLASTGKSGWTEQDGLYFAFYDRRERRWVNPAVLITGTISGVEDTVPPVIRQVELRNTAGTPFNPATAQRLPQGLYSIYVDAWDTLGQGGEALAPNRITCSVNGAETGVLSFETLISKDGKRMVYRNGPIPATEVFDEKGFGLGEIHLTRGQATLVIEARDMADNARSVTYRLTIE